MTFNLANPVFESSRRWAARPALWVGRQEISYSELAALGQRIARWLTDGAARPQGYVAILASRSLMAYAGVVGSCWAGDAYVPLNPQLPEEQLVRLLRVVQPVAIIADEAGLKGMTARVRESCRARLLTGFQELPEHDPHDRPRPMQAEDVAYMIFTSGSTGVPKGVMVPFRAVFQFIASMQQIYGFVPGDRFSQAFNLTFDVSVHDMFVAWNAGASVHVPPATQLMAPLKFIQERELTVWGSVPSTLVFMERMKMLPPGAFPSLRYSIFAGEPLPVRSAQAWQQAAPNSVIDNQYGPTECCVFSTMQRLTEPLNVTPQRGVVAIGKPLPGFKAGVLDESGSFLSPGQHGELVLTGPQVAIGYFQDAQRTAERFPVIDGQIWYRTGDQVYEDDSGAYHHLGRIDAQVKILGHRVELGEIEAHLGEICRSDAVAAVAWPVDHGSASGIVAFHCGEGLSPQQVRDAMTLRVPRYMVPKQVRRLENLPLTPNGKIDRKTLVEMLEKEQQN